MSLLVQLFGWFWSASIYLCVHVSVYVCVWVYVIGSEKRGNFAPIDFLFSILG